MFATIPILRSAAICTRHLTPLAATAALDGSVLIYLLLTLYDLGLGYCNHQLRKHWPALTSDALAAAESATERLFARMQLPLLFAFGGLAFVGTAALLLLPYLLMTDQTTAAWAEIGGNDGMLATSIITMAILASYGMHAQMRQLGQRWRQVLPAAEVAADRTLMQLAMFVLITFYGLTVSRWVTADPDIGLWLLALGFSAAQIGFDLRSDGAAPASP